jgi:[Skp1-protein]-hydroxyproline N-acetylglucosaminyltransferase
MAQQFAILPPEAFALTCLAGPRFLIRDDVLPLPVASRLACEARDLYLPTVNLAPAKVGADVRASLGERGDSIAWLTEDYLAGTGPFAPIFTHIRDHVRPALQPLFPSMGPRTSVQLARYGRGARYVRHADCGAESRRVVTVCFYLNPAWLAEHAGELRVFYVDPMTLKETHFDIAPSLNRMVVFPSNLEHEVLESLGSTRWALTFWFSAGKPVAAGAAAEGHLTLPPALPPAAADSAHPRPPVRDTIHVTIAAYHDPDLVNTLSDLFAKAADPGRVSVGVCWQSDAAPPRPSNREWNARVKWIVLDLDQARGPCPARALAHTLIADEEYVLQIDAHTRFAPGWDALLLRQIELCPSAQPVLTTYPSGFASLLSNASGSPLLCASKFDQDGMLRLAGRRLAAVPPHPTPSLFWAVGGCCGGRCAR